MSNSNINAKLAGTVKESIVDGPGIRYTIFFQGCPHDCKECHNPETHSFEKGEEHQVNELILDFKKNPLLSGITLSGGEPFCQPEAAYQLAKAAKEANLTVVTYTGYTFEELVEMGKENEFIKGLLEETDLLIDGPFVNIEKDLSLMFRGSKNQRLIDIKRTMEKGVITLWEE